MTLDVALVAGVRLRLARLVARLDGGPADEATATHFEAAYRDADGAVVFRKTGLWAPTGP